MGDNDTAPAEGTFGRLRRVRRADKKPSNVQNNGRTNRASNVRSNKGSQIGSRDATEYVIHISDQRKKLRRTFDVFEDQPTALEKIQLAAVDAGQKKPKLGEMVQEAIDLYVEKWAKKLPNVRLKKPTKK